LRLRGGERGRVDVWTVGRGRGGNGGMAGREIGKREAAIVAGDGKMAGAKYGKVPFHPGVDIALDVDKLLAVVGVGKWRRAGRLDLVPLAVDLGEWVDVMGEGIAVGDLHFLAHAKCQNVGRVVAALLIVENGA